MTTPVWPATTGFCLADGATEKFPVLVDRTDTDTGPGKQRFLGEGRPYRVTLNYLMTSAERDWLRWFHGSSGDGAAAGGAVWFTYTYPPTLEETIARFVGDDPPSVAPYKPDWIVTVQLEVVLTLTPPEAP